MKSWGSPLLVRWHSVMCSRPKRHFVNILHSRVVIWILRFVFSGQKCLPPLCRSGVIKSELERQIVDRWFPWARTQSSIIQHGYKSCFKRSYQLCSACVCANIFAHVLWMYLGPRVSLMERASGAWEGFWRPASRCQGPVREGDSRH